MKKIISFIIILFALLTVAAPWESHAQTYPANPQEIINLHAFAKLFGYVRFFHPSDESSKLDWNKFAIYGAGLARQARNADGLKKLLETLFKPIAPTMQIYNAGETPPDIDSAFPKAFPKDIAGLHVVAWQHRGVSLGSYNSKNNIFLSLRINEQAPDSTHLFATYPRIGEVIRKPLGEGLYCQIPLALYANDSGTLGADTAHPFARLQSQLDLFPAEDLTKDLKDDHLADIIVTWNVMQHFFPYFDVAGVNWDTELIKALEATLADSTDQSFYITFRKFIATLNDGHAFTYWSRAPMFYLALPCGMEWIQDHAVVMTTPDTSIFRPGDIIESVDGVPAAEELHRSEELWPGSPQWKRITAMEYFGAMDTAAYAHVVLKRNGKKIAKKVRRRQPYYPYKYKPVMQLEKGIYYIDLMQVSDTDYLKMQGLLASAKGLIFDMCGYTTKAAISLLTHLTGDTLYSPWWLMPEIIYPDHENLAGYDSARWALPPTVPRFKAKVVFLANGGANGFTESILGIVKHYKLGTIIGGATAGTDGETDPFYLSDGLHVTWTGMRVVGQDGVPYFLNGIQPDVRVERTLKSVLSGRDELMEKALGIIEGKK
ncbi:MAG TPA: S41 family peptidase [Candidatus Kapabacteria bacterium]|nr:S41 family peptidase [Candidatus Kapabacteria bacterium]